MRNFGVKKIVIEYYCSYIFEFLFFFVGYVQNYVCIKLLILFILVECFGIDYILFKFFYYFNVGLYRFLQDLLRFNKLLKYYQWKYIYIKYMFL